uniref:Uncharacterized protein n=1 Tax=Arundo donax TaxID=35708 RepID=A0A0A9D2E5_ARUDO
MRIVFVLLISHIVGCPMVLKCLCMSLHHDKSGKKTFNLL